MSHFTHSFTSAAAAALFNHDVLGFQYDETDVAENSGYTIDSLLDQAEAAGCLRPSVTQATIKAEVASLYEYYVEIGLEVAVNNIYREVYNRHGLLESYEAWKLVPIKQRKHKSFLKSLPIGI
jgi:hypothetical protein